MPNGRSADHEHMHTRLISPTLCSLPLFEFLCLCVELESCCHAIHSPADDLSFRPSFLPPLRPIIQQSSLPSFTSSSDAFLVTDPILCSTSPARRSCITPFSPPFLFFFFCLLDSSSCFTTQQLSSVNQIQKGVPARFRLIRFSCTSLPSAQVHIPDSLLSLLLSAPSYAESRRMISLIMICECSNKGRVESPGNFFSCSRRCCTALPASCLHMHPFKGPVCV